MNSLSDIYSAPLQSEPYVILILIVFVFVSCDILPNMEFHNCECCSVIASVSSPS